MMEPQEKLFRTSLDRVVEACERLVVLIYVSAAGTCPVEAYALRICLVLVLRQPVDACSGDFAPWLRTIMMCPCEDMVESKRHHIIYCSLA